MTIYETVLSVISDIQGSGGGLLVTALGSRGFLVQDMEGSGSRGNARKPSDQYQSTLEKGTKCATHNPAFTCMQQRGSSSCNVKKFQEP